MNYNNEPPRIFVSHSSDDNEFVDKLVSGLIRELGADNAVWYAKGDLAGGDEWWPTIMKEIDTRNVFIVVRSPSAMKSNYVKNEIKRAWKRRNKGLMKIIPLSYKPCLVRSNLNRLHSIDFISPNLYEEAFGKLLRALKTENDPLEPGDKNKEANFFFRRNVIKYVALGGLGIALSGSNAKPLFNSRSDASGDKSKSPPQQVRKKGWHRTEGPPEARENFSLTALPDGKALLVGGHIPGNGYPNDVYLFNPNIGSGKLEKITPLDKGRTEHTATLLPDGKVLIAGGYQGKVAGYLDLVERYDPDTKMWLPTQSMNQPRTFHSAISLLHDDVLVVGGRIATNYALSSTEIYNYQDGTWSVIDEPLNVGRWHPTCILLSNGKVIIAGGSNATSVCVPEIELFDPASQSWSLIQSKHLSTSLSSLGMTLLPSWNKILFIYGQGASETSNTVELYDPETDQWSPVNPMHTKRALDEHNNGIVLQDGTVLVAGNDASGTSEIYNPTTGRWSQPVPIATGQSPIQVSSVLLNKGQVNEQVLIVGEDYAFLYNV